MVLHVRSKVDPLGLVGALRAEVQRLDPNLPLFEIKTLSQRLSESIWPTRTMSKLIGIFGLLGSVLSVIGLYGVLSYNVGKRTKEIGIRRALGAQRVDVFRLIIGQGMLVVLFGVLLGLLLAVAATRVIGGFLYGVGTTDPLTFAVVVLGVAATAIVSCYLPARQATKVDPMVALREE
jgi:putative ABC transport system permease protein